MTPSPEGHATLAEQAYNLGQGQRPASYVEPAKPWQPWRNVGTLTDKLKSATAKEARKFEAAVKAARDEVRYLEDQQQKAIEAAEAARAKANNHRSAVDEAKKLNIDISEVIEKRNADADSKARAADPSIWRSSIAPHAPQNQGLVGEAQQRVKDARWHLDHFVTEHADELAKDLKAEQESVHKAISELRKQLAPWEARHDELTRTLAELYGRTEGVTEGHIPFRDYERKPELMNYALLVKPAEAKRSQKPEQKPDSVKDTALGESVGLREVREAVEDDADSDRHRRLSNSIPEVAR